MKTTSLCLGRWTMLVCALMVACPATFSTHLSAQAPGGGGGQTAETDFGGSIDDLRLTSTSGNNFSGPGCVINLGDDMNAYVWATAWVSAEFGSTTDFRLTCWIAEEYSYTLVDLSTHNFTLLPGESQTNITTSAHGTADEPYYVAGSELLGQPAGTLGGNWTAIDSEQDYYFTL